MGQCGQLCQNIYKSNQDFQIQMDEISLKFSDKKNLNKLKILQRKIKQFLHKKKKLQIRQPSNQEEKEFKNPEKKNSNCLQTSDKLKKDGNCQTPQNVQGKTLFIMIPAVIPNFRSKTIFREDPFISSPKNLTKNGTFPDPRLTKDNVRKDCPIIREGTSSYKGEWKDGKRDGLGVLTYKTVSKYIGNFKDNQVEGFGILEQEEGDIYKGNWKNSNTCGWGIYQTKKDAVYKGNWLNDKQNGFGIEAWPKGACYEGEYENGNKEGIGILNFEINGEYKGEFKGGSLNGIGVFEFKDGRKYKGMWKNNKMDGYGIISWPDTKLYEGEFVEDKKEGFGIFYSLKKIYMGIWRNSLLDGNVIIIEKDKIRKQIWQNGRASKNLPDNYNIKFEVYINEAIEFRKNNNNVED